MILLRSALTMALIVGSYFEAGICTALALFFISISLEGAFHFLRLLVDKIEDRP